MCVLYRNASVYSGCVRMVNCSDVKDSALIVDLMTASRHANLYQYVCSSNIREGSSRYILVARFSLWHHLLLLLSNNFLSCAHTSQVAIRDCLWVGSLVCSLNQRMFLYSRPGILISMTWSSFTTASIYNVSCPMWFCVVRVLRYVAMRATNYR